MNGEYFVEECWLTRWAKSIPLDDLRPHFRIIFHNLYQRVLYCLVLMFYQSVRMWVISRRNSILLPLIHAIVCILQLQVPDLGCWFGFQSTHANIPRIKIEQYSELICPWLVSLPTILKNSQSRWWHVDTHQRLEGYRCPLQPASSHWYWLQLYLWRLQVTLLLALFATLNIFIDISSYIMPNNSLHNLVICSVFPLCEATALECSESPIPWCTSLIISIWHSLPLINNLFL